VVDWLAAAAAVAFLALHARYAVFIDNAEMVRDYAEKDREARALAQVNEELRRLDELKSEFLAMVSHELRARCGDRRLQPAASLRSHGTLSSWLTIARNSDFSSSRRRSSSLTCASARASRSSRRSRGPSPRCR